MCIKPDLQNMVYNVTFISVASILDLTFEWTNSLSCLVLFSTIITLKPRLSGTFSYETPVYPQW